MLVIRFLSERAMVPMYWRMVFKIAENISLLDSNLRSKKILITYVKAAKADTLNR